MRFDQSLSLTNAKKTKQKNKKQTEKKGLRTYISHFYCSFSSGDMAVKGLMSASAECSTVQIEHGGSAECLSPVFAAISAFWDLHSVSIKIWTQHEGNFFV